MKSKYAYSYDREDYTGAYDAPEAAFADAVKRSEGLASPPTTIYIGRIVEPDPQTTDHAEGIVEAMNRRAHVDFGDVAEKYLKKVDKEHVQELDAAISATIHAWLQRHNLMPTFVRVTAIQEYPVHVPQGVIQPAGNEVQDIGAADSVGDN